MKIKLKYGSDLKLLIATGKSRKEIHWKNQEMSWSALLSKLSETTRTHETVQEFRDMSRDDQSKIKDIGGFVGGALKEGRRLAAYVEARSVITLDADFAPQGFWDDILLSFDKACAVYSTHKHTPEMPRLRVIIPMSRAVTPDEHEAVARYVANIFGMDYFDDTTYEANRLMYWPSTSKDGEYFFKYQDAPILDPDEILQKYINWQDCSYWPTSSRVESVRKKKVEKAGDPTLKTGLVGAFCRAYTIEEAMAKFIPGVYIPTNQKGRYTYSKGSSAAGLVIYEDGKFAFSNHATDPACGQLLNAFDLVRIHLYGEDDKGQDIDTPVNRLPSWKSMVERCKDDPGVKAALAEDRLKEVSAEFGTYEGTEAPEQTNAEGKKQEATKDDKKWMSKLSVNGKGCVEPTPANFKLIVENDPRLKGIKGLDRFSDRKVVEGTFPWARDVHNSTWTDTDAAGLRWYISVAYHIEGKEKIQDAVDMVFEQRAFHPVKDYIESVKWDGVPRVERVLVTFLGAEDTIYTRAVTRKALVAAVARVYNPGCKFDYMLTVTGKQGIGKTLLFNKLAGDWFSNSMIDIRGKESYEALDGVWIMEMGELAALKRSDRDVIKNYISKTEDVYRKAYGRNTTIAKRHSIFIGTTNEKTFLEDDTGNRRFWVVDTDATKRTRTVWADEATGETGLTSEEVHQIWAEALYMYQHGENIMQLTPQELEGAKEAQEDHTFADEFLPTIEAYLNLRLPLGWYNQTIAEHRQYLSATADFDPVEQDLKEEGIERTMVSILEVWCEALKQDGPKTLDRTSQNRIGKCLDHLGWVKVREPKYVGREYGTRRGCYVKPKGGNNE